MLSRAPCCPTCGQPVNDNVEAVILERKIRPKEAAILRALAAAKGRTLSHEHLLDVIYGDDPDGGPDNAKMVYRVHMTHLRKKLAGTGLAIATVWGAGYRLAPGVAL